MIYWTVVIVLHPIFLISETETNESSLPIAPLNSTASLLHDLPEMSLQTVHQNQSQIALARDVVKIKELN